MTLGESSCYQGPSSTNNFNPVTVEFGNMMEHLSLSSEDKQALVSALTLLLFCCFFSSSNLLTPYSNDQTWKCMYVYRCGNEKGSM